MHEELTITNYMKYKRQLMGSMLALTIIVSGSTVFAADVHVATATKAHLFRNQVKMKSNESDGKVDLKDANGKDLETNDDATTTASSTKIHGVKNTKSDMKKIPKSTTDKKVKTVRVHKVKENKTASSTKSL
jgi:hypothetical protein